MLSLGGGRHGEQGAARRAAHADEGRSRCLPFHTARVTGVHEHADGARGRGTVASKGAQQVGRAVETGDVWEAKYSRAVVLCLQAASETVLSAVAARCACGDGGIVV